MWSTMEVKGKDHCQGNRYIVISVLELTKRLIDKYIYIKSNDIYIKMILFISLYSTFFNYNHVNWSVMTYFSLQRSNLRRIGVKTTHPKRNWKGRGQYATTWHSLVKFLRAMRCSMDNMCHSIRSITKNPECGVLWHGKHVLRHNYGKNQRVFTLCCGMMPCTQKKLKDLIFFVTFLFSILFCIDYKRQIRFSL